MTRASYSINLKVDRKMNANSILADFKVELQEDVYTSVPTLESAVLQLVNAATPQDFLLLAFPQAEQIRNRIATILEELKASENSSLSKELKDKQKQIAHLQKSLNRTHYKIFTCEKLVELCESENLHIKRNNESIYLYLGTHFEAFEPYPLTEFLRKIAISFEVPESVAKDAKFIKDLIEQCFTVLPFPRLNDIQNTFINLKNGVLEVTKDKQVLHKHSHKHFFTYCLEYDFKSEARCEKWLKFLSEILPDHDSRLVLQEYLGYVLTKSLKMEKALILLGEGSNGKSVVFDVVNALYGVENISTYSIKDLCDKSNYYAAGLENKILNYGSELSKELNTETFKKIVSNEPVEVRLPYKAPYQLRNYAKLMFNANKLPKSVEQTHGFFRRFMILPFQATISDAKKDVELANKIIENELEGVLAWVLSGLKRLLVTKRFTDCKAAKDALNTFKIESCSVATWCEEVDVKTIKTDCKKKAKEVYADYRKSAIESGSAPVGSRNFYKRMENLGFMRSRDSILGNVFSIDYESEYTNY